MVLTSKNFFGALQIDLDLNIRKKGYLNPKIRIRMHREGSEFCLLSKTIYGPHLLLLANFDLPFLLGAILLIRPDFTKFY